MTREPRLQCEQCGNMVPESDATTETYPGPRQHTVTLAFCPECINRGVQL